MTPVPGKDRQKAYRARQKALRSVTRVTGDARYETVTEDVNMIYLHYPRKVGKRAALKAIERALSRIDRANRHKYLLEQVRLFSLSPKGRGDFCPYPATWFNQDRFDDDPKEWEEGRHNAATDDKRARNQAILDQTEAK